MLEGMHDMVLCPTTWVSDSLGCKRGPIGRFVSSVVWKSPFWVEFAVAGVDV